MVAEICRLCMCSICDRQEVILSFMIVVMKTGVNVENIYKESCVECMNLQSDESLQRQTQH